jgi:hypothetical protein
MLRPASFLCLASSPTSLLRCFPLTLPKFLLRMRHQMKVLKVKFEEVPRSKCKLRCSASYGCNFVLPARAENSRRIEVSACLKVGSESLSKASVEMREERVSITSFLNADEDSGGQEATADRVRGTIAAYWVESHRGAAECEPMPTMERARDSRAAAMDARWRRGVDNYSRDVASGIEDYGERPRGIAWKFGE